MVLWHLGYPDQALEKSKAAHTLAQELSYPYSLGAARVFAALSHQLRRERALTQEWAEAGITLAREHKFPLWLGQGTILQGWARTDQGQSEDGISQICQGLATHEAIGAGLLKSYYLILLAEVYGKAGQAEEGLAALAEALTVVDTSGERFYEAELYRLAGELSLRMGEAETGRTGDAEKETENRRGGEAETEDSFFFPDSPVPRFSDSLAEFPVSSPEEFFQKAIEIARRQSAKSLELRAATSLSQLWHQQGKKTTARELLAEIYHWFTEGFDTKDLQEAKALLEELT